MDEWQDAGVGGGPSDGLFSAIPIIIGLGFVLVLGTIAYRMVTGAKQWSDNNASPVLTRTMTVVTKRTLVSHTSGSVNAADGMTQTSGSSHTTYFVTFEEPGTRRREEFRVAGREYGQLAEGDVGPLTSQGTRYQGFVRT